MPGLNYKGTSKYQKLTETLLKKTHFTESEIDRLADLHAKLMNNGNYTSKITRKRFREFLHANFDLNDDTIMDRIFKYFNTETADDIDLEEWIVGFSVILKGSQQEQIRYCFNVYDLNDDGFISREEMLTILGNCLTKIKNTAMEEEGEEEGVKDLVDMTIKKMDYDKDGKISYQDFLLAVNQDSLMLEAFGACLPSGRVGQQFIDSVLDQTY